MNKSLSAIVRGPFKHELELEVFHQGFGFNVVVEYFYTPEEKPTSDCPGSPEDFEIVEFKIPRTVKQGVSYKPYDFFADFIEEFGEELDFLRVISWFKDVEESINKAFFNKIEKMKKEDF